MTPPPPGHQRLAPGVSLPTAALSWSQSRSGGAGGQHVNKTESKAELRLPIAAIVGLAPRAMDRLVDLAGERLTADGELIMTCDETRSLGRNRDMLWDRLCELVLSAQAVPKLRRRTKPSWGSVQRRLEAKAHVADRKRDRRIE